MDIEQEIWKSVNASELYPRFNRHEVLEVSNLGNLRLDGKPVKTYLNNNAKPYLKTTHVHGNMLVHRLVAYAFCEGYEPGMQVNHINEVKTDNRASNLEWVTASYNQNFVKPDDITTGAKGGKNRRYTRKGPTEAELEGYAKQSKTKREKFLNEGLSEAQKAAFKANGERARLRRSRKEYTDKELSYFKRRQKTYSVTVGNETRILSPRTEAVKYSGLSNSGFTIALNSKDAYKGVIVEVVK